MSKDNPKLRSKQERLTADLTTRIREFQDETGCAVIGIAVRNEDERFGPPRLIDVEVIIEIDVEDEVRKE
jgi:hypothetical protein